MHFNECSQLSYSSVQMALTRLAEKNNLVKRIYYDQNPPKKSHWSYYLFEKGLDPIDNEPIDRPENYSKILMNPIDNLDNIDEDYLNMLKSLPEAERQRFMLGEYGDSSDGQAYYSFDREKHVQKTVVEGGSTFIALDFNVDPMTGVIAQIYDDKVWVHDEMFLRNSDTYKACEYLKSKKYFGSVIPDSTGKNRKTSGQSDFDILESNGFKIEPCKNPFITDRVNNINRLFQAGRIIINPKAKKLINDLEKVSWKDNKLDQKTDKMLTHISDALGYLCYWYEPMKGKVWETPRGIR